MSTPALIPMIGPDGSQAMVPQAQFQAAQAAGAKLGLPIRDPQGNKGLVPVEQYHAALGAGAIPEVKYQQQQSDTNPDPNTPGIISSTSRFLGGALGAVKDAAVGAYRTTMQPAQTPQETAISAVHGQPGVILNRVLMQPSENLYTQAKQLAYGPNSTATDKLNAIGRGVAAALPIVGPGIVGIGDSMRPQIESGNYAGAAGNLAGNLGMAYLTDKVGGAVMDKLNARLPIPGQNYTPANAAAFEGLISKPGVAGKNFFPQDTTPQALSPLRQTAADMLTGSPTDQAIVQTLLNKSSDPLDRIGAMTNITQKALTNLESQHAPVLAANASVPVNMAPIQSAIRSNIVPGMSDADIAGINDLISRSGQIQNLGDLNGFRQMLNSEASPAYRQTPTAAGRAMAPQDVMTQTADAVRSHYFDQLQQATGTDFRPLKQQESHLLTTKEALENLQSPMAKAEAQFNAPSTLRETAGNVANIIKDPRATVTQTILRESPATQPSYYIQKAMQNLPDAQPSLNNPLPANYGPMTNASQLPANATPPIVKGVSQGTISSNLKRILALSSGDLNGR